MEKYCLIALVIFLPVSVSCPFKLKLPASTSFLMSLDVQRMNLDFGGAGGFEIDKILRGYWAELVYLLFSLTFD